jgi:ABC-2 type transport system ATP-binding protein
VTALLGPNGAGKTTTMRLLLGLATPDEGRALIQGRAYRELAEPLHTVGALVDSAGFHPRRRARDELRILATAGGVPVERVSEVLDLVDLGKERGRIGGFSTGMRQRLGIAAALLGHPTILILDEPSLGLDPAGQVWLREYLRERAAAGGTVLVSSHLLNDVEHLADRVLVLDHGRLVADDSLADFVAAARRDVLVLTAEPDALAAALRTHGGQVIRDGALLRVRGLPMAEVGQVAARSGATLHELREDVSHLEEAFLAVTSVPPGPAADEESGRRPS